MRKIKWVKKKIKWVMKSSIKWVMNRCIKWVMKKNKLIVFKKLSIICIEKNLKNCSCFIINKIIFKKIEFFVFFFKRIIYIYIFF
jgi:hypothetical protein